MWKRRAIIYCPDGLAAVLQKVRKLMSNLKATIGADKNQVTLKEIRKAFLKCFENDGNNILLNLLEDGAFSGIDNMTAILPKLDAFKDSTYGDDTRKYIKNFIQYIQENGAIYGGEELVIQFKNELLRAEIRDLDEKKTVRFYVEKDFANIASIMIGNYESNILSDTEKRKRIREAYCTYLSRMEGTEETVKQLRFFLSDKDQLFYEIIGNLQKKNNQRYQNFSPEVYHNLEAKFSTQDVMFDDEIIEAGPDGFVVKKPNGIEKVIVTVA